MDDVKQWLSMEPAKHLGPTSQLDHKFANCIPRELIRYSDVTRPRGATRITNC